MYNNIIYADETNMFLKATLLQMTNWRTNKHSISRKMWGI